ncbi:hypothetical protein ACJW30_07G092700 [Castanea mollissima]
MPLDEKSLIEYIKAVPFLYSKLGSDLKVKEVGDDNLNFVYIVVSHARYFVMKQALPYMRCIGESWSMTKERAYFEAVALTELGRLSLEHVPKVCHFDLTMSLIGMHYLEPPHIIVTLYFTSLLYRSTSEHKRAVAEFCGNMELCRLTEQVVFSDPSKVSQYNHWTSPYLDCDAEALREGNVLKLEVAELKSKFCERDQALLHGDLDASSVMVTHESTQVLDPDFAFYWPMGFDIGAFLGNLILAFFAQDGHADQVNDRKTYKEWILRTIEDTWNLFNKKFIALWDEHKDGSGEAYLPAIYNNPELHQLVQKKFMEDLFHYTLGFGAAKMIRRIVDVAHVEDIESITDASRRADCGHRALEVAKLLLKERRKFHAITEVISAIQKLQS